MYSRPVPRGPLRRVAVTGSTHGNEMSGVSLVQHWRRAPEELQRPSFSALPVLANPRAAAACRRYVDLDLNRAFISTFLTARPQPDDPYEVTRARELNQLLGPKASSQAFDFVLDLHNTTANMGACFICNNADNVFTMHLCRYLQAWALTHPLAPAVAEPGDPQPRLPVPEAGGGELQRGLAGQERDGTETSRPCGQESPSSRCSAARTCCTGGRELCTPCSSTRPPTMRRASPSSPPRSSGSPCLPCPRRPPPPDLSPRVPSLCPLLYPCSPPPMPVTLAIK
ncbi:N-acyl-aromatic-L-amino acid amidohydrolase (carboxylate-forming) isoform X3 [Erinaceus europaeus]|uniref:N-acyl-aromatic-L-amino acid amidohydrolase (Carboxylate-forming) isoform X3 n=1 Tax=Erinaceus europaeus TaxID=9365 RepID=A0ABM3W5R1_ERIEU|nr:N-acyl-aromatic-L-amino acid amidohydrolase (carboxylate-forming) isoform X3 [Erinaceus europaeus]